MNVLALVSYNRPALLQIYLEQLLKDREELDKYLVHFFLDYGYNPENLIVIKKFSKEHKAIKLTTRSQDTRIGPPGFYNIVQSYKDACLEADEFVVLGEDDIIPTDDYLRFNRLVYENFLSKYDRIFCLAHKRRADAEKTGKPEVLIGDYQITSPSCIAVKTIKERMFKHIENPLFFSNQLEYNQKYFSNIRIPTNMHTHHDGMIERIAESERMFSLKPDHSRSMHIAIGGQHCGSAKEIIGSLDAKVKKYYELIDNKEELKSYAVRFKEDIVVVPLNNPKYDHLELDIDRKKAIASEWFYDTKNEFKEYINNVAKSRGCKS